jgi:hypothetical protein
MIPGRGVGRILRRTSAGCIDRVKTPHLIVIDKPLVDGFIWIPIWSTIVKKLAVIVTRGGYNNLLQTCEFITPAASSGVQVGGLFRDEAASRMSLKNVRSRRFQRAIGGEKPTYATSCGRKRKTIYRNSSGLPRKQVMSNFLSVVIRLGISAFPWKI